MTGRKFTRKYTRLSIAAFLFIAAASVHEASAQMSDVMVVRQKARTTIRPKAKPTATKVNVNKRVTIVRVSKKSRSNYKKPATKSVQRIQVPLLAAQLRLLNVNSEGFETEVNPIAAFMDTDRLRLSIKANQSGYLYVIRQSSPEAEGEIIFPTTLVNNGSNLVRANIEYVLPSNCPKEFAPTERECSLELMKFADAPQEFFTLIFTRDSLVDLPNDAKKTRVSLANLMSAGKLPSETLVSLIEDSGQDLVAQQGDSEHAVRIVNINPKDNEEIIETFVINKLNR